MSSGASSTQLEHDSAGISRRFGFRPIPCTFFKWTFRPKYCQGTPIAINSTQANRQSISRLFTLRNQYSETASDEKLVLLGLLEKTEIRNCSGLERLHAALCFIRAFPDSLEHYRLAQSQLDTFGDRIGKLPGHLRAELWDTGIAGTPVHYCFSFEVATWLKSRAPNTVSIDWSEVDDTSRLDELLAHLLLPPEEDYFDSGHVGSKEWIELAASGIKGTDFDWLLAQLREKTGKPVWSPLYNAAEIPLAWKLDDSALSKTRNIVPVPGIQPRGGGLRKRVRDVKREIMRPLDSLRRVSPGIGAKLIDAAMASLAVRHRETNHFNFANPKEIYLADVGEGISIAVFGLKEQHRYPLETTMGYLILSNGVPIGYGGASALFRQVNTGINIFDEYRGSEAAFLWTAVMRVYHNLFDCTRFIVNAYQFGNENPEALESGAFWFYYRLGYRPVLSAVRSLAQRESRRMQRNRSYRSDRSTLLRLAACDMHMTLPGARASDLFDEQWLETSSMLATEELARAGGSTRGASADSVAMQVARDLGIRSIQSSSSSVKRGFRRLAPFIAATEPANWSANEKRAMRRLLRAKGGTCEAEYAKLLCQDRRFLSELRKRCRRADR